MGRYKFKTKDKTLELYDKDKNVIISPINFEGIELILNLQDEMIKELEKKITDKGE